MFNKEDKIKWNDLSRSLQDIIMRRMTWKMLHPSLQKWLLHLEARVTELERNLYYMWHGQQGQVAKVDIAGKYLYPSDNFFVNGATISLTEQNETYLGDSNLDIYRLDQNRVYPAEDYSTSTYHQIDDHENRVLMYNPVLEHLYYYTQKNIYIKLFPYLDVLRLILYKLWADGKQGQVVKIDKTDNTLYPHNNFIDSKNVVDNYDVSVQGHSGTYNVETTSSHKVVYDELEKSNVKTTNRILLYNPQWEHLFWGLEPENSEKLFPYLDVLRDEILHRLWAKGEDGQVPKIELKSSTYSKVHSKGILFPHDNFVVTKDVTKENANKLFRTDLMANNVTLHGAPVVKDNKDKVDDSGVISESGTDFLVISNITTGGPGVNRILIYNPKEEEMFWYQKENRYTILFKTLCDLKDDLRDMFANGKMGQVLKVNPDEKKVYAHNNFIDSEDVVDNYDVNTQGHSGTYNVQTTSNHKKVNDVLDGEVETTNRILFYNPKWEHLFWGLQPKKKEKLFPYLDVLRDEILHQLWDKGEDGQIPKIKPKSSTYSKVHSKGILFPHDEVIITGEINRDNANQYFGSDLTTLNGAPVVKDDENKTVSNITIGGSGANRILLYNPIEEELFWYLKKGSYTMLFSTLSDLKNGLKDMFADGEMGQVLKVNPDKKKVYPHDEVIITKDVTKDNFTSFLGGSHDSYEGATGSSDNTITHATQGSNRVLLYNPDDETMFWYEESGKYTRIFPSMTTGGPYATQDEVDVIKEAIKEIPTITGGGGSYDDTWIHNEFIDVWDAIHKLQSGGGGGGGTTVIGGGGDTIVGANVKYCEISYTSDAASGSGIITSFNKETTLDFVDRSALQDGQPFKVSGQTVATIAIDMSSAAEDAQYDIYIPFTGIAADPTTSTAGDGRIVMGGVETNGVSLSAQDMNYGDECVITKYTPVRPSGNYDDIPSWLSHKESVNTVFVGVVISKTTSQFTTLKVTLKFAAWVASYKANDAKDNKYPRQTVSAVQSELQPENFNGSGSASGSSFKTASSLISMINIYDHTANAWESWKSSPYCAG